MKEDFKKLVKNMNEQVESMKQELKDKNAKLRNKNKKLREKDIKLKDSEKITKKERKRRKRAEKAKERETAKRKFAEQQAIQLQNELDEIKKIIRFVSNNNREKIEFEYSKMLYTKILDNPVYLQKFTGMTPGMFELFHRFFKKQVKKDLAVRSRSPKKNKSWYNAAQFFIGEPTRGKTCKLVSEHAVLLGLMCLRTGIQQQRLAIILGVSQTLVSHYTNYLKRVIVRFCTSVKSISGIIKRCSTIKARKVWIPGYKGGEIVTDGTEIKVYEPIDDIMEYETWSTKKHQHSYSIGIIVTKEGLIVHITDPRGGRGHDKTILVESKIDWGKWSKDMKNPNIPKSEQFIFRGDSAYTGILKDYPGIDPRVTYKKPKGGELTEEQTEFNRINNSHRVIVENIFAIMKRYGCLQGRFIGDLDDFDLTFDAVATLVNFELLWDKKNDKPTPRMLELMKSANLV